METTPDMIMHNTIKKPVLIYQTNKIMPQQILL